MSTIKGWPQVRRGQLGNLYSDVVQLDNARKHFERAVQYFEKAGNHHTAGGVRFNMAIMYLDAADEEALPSQERACLHRTHAYAEAALRDFQHYQGRAAAAEAKPQQLLAVIAQALHTAGGGAAEESRCP